jgi:hypothetical protein
VIKAEELIEDEEILICPCGYYGCPVCDPLHQSDEEDEDE